MSVSLLVYGGAAVALLTPVVTGLLAELAWRLRARRHKGLLR